MCNISHCSDHPLLHVARPVSWEPTTRKLTMQQRRGALKGLTVQAANRAEGKVVSIEARVLQ